MCGLWREVNEFFSSTSIHGFSYISNKQSRSTRIIWTLIVLAVFGVASYLVYQTLSGFKTKFVSTTIETKSIKEYPFPAVTFHPGDYNSEHTLLKTLLNQFEFTRYDSKSVLRNNEEFMDSWSSIVYPMSMNECQWIYCRAMRKYSWKQNLYIRMLCAEVDIIMN